MEKKAVKIGAVIILLTVICTGFWLMPVKPLRGCTPDEITKISIEGKLGLENITDPEIVRTIAENIDSCGAKRSGISFSRRGYACVIYCYKGDECISSFSLCGKETARDSFFFYKPLNGTYCTEYINNLPVPEPETKQ